MKFCLVSSFLVCKCTSKSERSHSLSIHSCMYEFHPRDFIYLLFLMDEHQCTDLSMILLVEYMTYGLSKYFLALFLCMKIKVNVFHSGSLADVKRRLKVFIFISMQV